MARQVINSNDTGLSARTKLNANFLELYDDVAALQAGGGGGGGAWGSITGTLSSQTDLAQALALKAPLAAPQFTGAWNLAFGYLASSLRPFSTEGFPGLGWHNAFGTFIGGISAGNNGTFNLEFSNGTRIALAAVAAFNRYNATDGNGGGSAFPLFVLDDTSGNEGGFWCQRTGGVATIQYWGSGRAARVGLSRDGRFEFLTGTTPVFNPAASVTPSANGNLVIEATSNTSLTFKLRGSDGTVRSGSVTLS